MSPLKCHTVQEAIWERAASAGPSSLSPALADHLATCPGCQSESRAVGELLTVARSIADPEPPADLWDGFDEELDRRIAGARLAPAGAWDRWGRRATAMAAMLVLGIAIGIGATRVGGPSPADRAAADRAALVATLADDARLEAYLAQVETHLDDARDREPLPAGLVAGPGAPSAEAAQRTRRAEAERERLRALLLATLVAELEAETHGFAYLDRRIADLAGEHYLYFVP